MFLKIKNAFLSSKVIQKPERRKRMRYKNDQQSHFSWATGTHSKIVKAYEEKYNRISQILDDNPEILDVRTETSKNSVKVAKEDDGRPTHLRISSAPSSFTISRELLFEKSWCELPRAFFCRTLSGLEAAPSWTTRRSTRLSKGSKPKHGKR